MALISILKLEVGYLEGDEDKSMGRIGVGHFRGIYIANEKKNRFLVRGQAANDPWLWALQDHQVDKSMLLEVSEAEPSTVDEQNGGIGERG